ncbi:MAG: fatty acid desaturase [Hyphomicrobiaceae bacterium]
MPDEITHREALAAISEADLVGLKALENGPGLRHLGAHLGAIGLTTAAILSTDTPLLLVPLLVLHGILLIFLFTPLHETIHGTAFRTAWLNDAVSHLLGFLILLPPRWFRYFHLAHHRHTQDPQNDPELSSPKPRSIGQYLWRLTGISYWTSEVRLIATAAAGHVSDPFVPPKGRPKVIIECRAFLAGYLLLGLASVWLGTGLLIWLWVLPAILGQPFLRAYLMAEHTGLPLVSNMLSNSRTVFASWPVQWLAWNMPHHAAHHALPVVPFHRLPALTARIRQHLRATADGYPEAHRQIRGSFGAQSVGRGLTPDGGSNMSNE